MATQRHYLKSTQTEPGTTGTPSALGAVVDLSTTQGSPTTLASGNRNSSTFALCKRFTKTVGTTIANGSQLYACSVVITSSDGDDRWRYRLVRLNSSGVQQAASSYSAERGPGVTGTFTDNITWNAGTWAADDRLALEFELAWDASGDGGFLFGINNVASYVDAELAAASAGQPAARRGGMVREMKRHAIGLQGVQVI